MDMLSSEVDKKNQRVGCVLCWVEWPRIIKAGKQFCRVLPRLAQSTIQFKIRIFNYTLDFFHQ